MNRDKIMKQNDYCYACVAVSSDGQEHICGFSRTFAGIKDVREAYLEACQNEDIEGMTFATPERLSRNDIIDFFTDLKEENVERTYLLHGLIAGV